MESQSFGQFMQEWLYGDGTRATEIFGVPCPIGYYRQARVGKDLDFYTNVSVGEFFGYTIGFYLHNIASKLQGRIAIVEIGSEKGDLIADIAEFFALFDKNLRVDFITLEPLESLQTLQQQTWQARGLESQLLSFRDFTELRNLKYDSVLFVSNELLDAFPAELVMGDKMTFVSLENGNFTLQFKEIAPKVRAMAQEFGIKIGEIPLGASDFAKDIASVAQNWRFLGFDYGSMEARNAFSLRLYHKHNTQNVFKNATTGELNAESLANFGIADLTYDVHFGLWQKAFENIGGKTLFLHRQNRALVDMGLDKMCEWYIAHFGLQTYMQKSAKLRSLISPSAFGERFFGFCFGNF